MFCKTCLLTDECSTNAIDKPSSRRTLSSRTMSSLRIANISSNGCQHHLLPIPQRGFEKPPRRLQHICKWLYRQWPPRTRRHTSKVHVLVLGPWLLMPRWRRRYRAMLTLIDVVELQHCHKIKYVGAWRTLLPWSWKLPFAVMKRPVQFLWQHTGYWQESYERNGVMMTR